MLGFAFWEQLQRIASTAWQKSSHLYRREFKIQTGIQRQRFVDLESVVY
jgi:hypothetical protein